MNKYRLYFRNEKNGEMLRYWGAAENANQAIQNCVAWLANYNDINDLRWIGMDRTAV